MEHLTKDFLLMIKKSKDFNRTPKSDRGKEHRKSTPVNGSTASDIFNISLFLYSGEIFKLTLIESGSDDETVYIYQTWPKPINYAEERCINSQLVDYFTLALHRSATTFHCCHS